MSPVPEPMQSRKGEPGGNDEEELNPPSGLALGQAVSSSDDEHDANDTENETHNGYIPLPQYNDVDEEENEGEIDYSSLSGLMSALATHGPNVVDDAEEEESSDVKHEEVEGAVGIASNISTSTSTLAEEAEQQRKNEIALEQATVWNSPAPERLSLDGNKVEEIKSVMASFSLPQSAIPPWAKDLSEEDWKNQVACLISNKKAL
ncbi:uncharacterized protein LOC134783192 [Penaeus indicus]|uniref:uncharacterized protein LOC134783192 n=1 Tax=Penaeus indicus TaxID=29960 RepID=UPI00300CFA86